MPLFERVGKRLVLNDAGRALLPQALAVLEQTRGIEQAFSAKAANMPVRLRVAASTTIGTYALPQVLARLARSHPLVRVDLQIANTQEVGEAVQALEVDLGLIEGSSHWQGLEVEPWLSDELVIVASPGDLLAQQARSKPLGVAALRKAAWLLREAGSGTREMVEHALLPHLHQLPAAATLGSSEAIARCVEQGLGISCLSRVLVEAQLQAGRWRSCPPPCRACGAISRWCSVRASGALRRWRLCRCLPCQCAAGISMKTAFGRAAHALVAMVLLVQQFLALGLLPLYCIDKPATSRAAPGQTSRRITMKTIDEMLHLDLLTHEQHLQISHWIDAADSPKRSCKCRRRYGRPWSAPARPWA